MSLLGLDVGTTGCKAIAFDLDGKILSQAYREYQLLHPQPGWAELDASGIWQSVVEIIKEVNQHVKKDPVKALSVSCQGEAVTAIDNNGEPLCNFSVAFDHRTIPQAQWWRENWGAERLFKISGMPLHSMYTINKIMWYKENCPDLFHKTFKFLCVEDYVNYKLTGRFAIDWSLAARTMAFDVTNKCWSEEILNAAGIDADLLPTPFPSATGIGKTTPAMREELGFQSEVTVATGGHDQPCGALGAGITNPGTAMNAIGTSDVICPVFAQPVLSEQMLKGNYSCYPHVGPEQYVSVGFNLTGGLLLRWYRDTLCTQEANEAFESNCDVYDIIIEQASSEITSLFILPHFVGAGTPYLDSHSRGAIVGLTVDTNKQNLSKAVLDSINYEMKLNIDLMNETGSDIQELRTIGGGAKSGKWLQMRADTFDLPVSSMQTSEAASLGAAMLAGVSIGAFKDLSEATAAMVQIKHTYHPDEKRSKLYLEKYQQYRQLYPALKSFNNLIANI